MLPHDGGLWRKNIFLEVMAEVMLCGNNTSLQRSSRLKKRRDTLFLRVTRPAKKSLPPRFFTVENFLSPRESARTLPFSMSGTSGISRTSTGIFNNAKTSGRETLETVSHHKLSWKLQEKISELKRLRELVGSAKASKAS